MKITGLGPMDSNNKRGQGSSWTTAPVVETNKKEK
jgi:hypothetical protein